jgi:hypothetical protein
MDAATTLSLDVVPVHDDERVDSAPMATTPFAPASRLGERLRSLRLAAGLTQTQVAGE